MQEYWVAALNARRRDIHQRWEALLRLEGADGPLAEPDNLVHLIDWTFDEVLGEIRRRKASRRSEAPPSAIATLRAECHCGHNPLFNHFIAGERALLEALIQLQAAHPLRRSTAVAELYVAIRAIAMREVNLLCSMCAKRPHPRTHASTGKVAAAA